MKIIEKKLGEYASLTCYLHENTPELPNQKEYPAILVVPGGGFRICSDREGEPVAMAFFAQGYQAFVLKYTVVTIKSDAVMADPMLDAQMALDYIRSERESLLCKEGQLAMIGFSGGGHLSAAVSTHGPSRPDALLLGYPGIVHSDLRALDCPDIPECVDQNTPPTFMFGLYNDPVTPPKHILAFASALDQAGIEFEIHMFHGEGHGLSLGIGFTCADELWGINDNFAQWLPLSIRWLNHIFSKS